MSDHITMDKKDLRQAALKTRHQFRHMYDGSIAEKAAVHGMQALSDIKPASAIAAYWPIGDELDPRPLMRDLARHGHVCLLPVMKGKGLSLGFRPWDMGDPLEDGPHGTRHPVAAAPEIIPDIILTPLLAFDSRGHRLGWGGGYYDRTLAIMPDARAFGFAYAGQRLDHLPVKAHDRALDAVITETGTIWCLTPGA